MQDFFRFQDFVPVGIGVESEVERVTGKVEVQFPVGAVQRDTLPGGDGHASALVGVRPDAVGRDMEMPVLIEFRYRIGGAVRRFQRRGVVKCPTAVRGLFYGVNRCGQFRRGGDNVRFRFGLLSGVGETVIFHAVAVKRQRADNDRFARAGLRVRERALGGDTQIVAVHKAAERHAVIV